MMESANCIKEVLRAANQYHHNSGQLAYLLHQLELQSCDQVELIECLTFLVEVVREEHGQLELMQRAVRILLNLSHDENVKRILYETFNICTSLASLVVAYSGLTEEQTLSEALQLLQRITYGHRIDYHQAHVEDLLKFLVQHVLSQTEALISPVLGTLANLCRNNLLVQSAIRNMNPADVKKLLKILCGFFSQENQTVVVFALSIFTSISLNESEGQKVFFDNNNVEQTLQTIFSIIVNRYKTATWKYAADLLVDLLRHPQMQICIKKYRHLNKCMSNILSLLSIGSHDSASEVFELLLSLCAVPSIRQTVNVLLFTPMTQGSISNSTMLETVQLQSLPPGTEPLLCCMHCAAQSGSKTAESALHFLKDSVQDCLWDSNNSYPVHLMTPVFISLLSQHTQTERTDKTTALVKLVRVLLSAKHSGDSLSKCITSETIASLVESQLSLNYVSCVTATSTLTQEGTSREDGTLCVLLVLDLALKLRKFIPELSDCLAKTLKEPRVMDFMAVGLTSTSQEQVEIAIRLLCTSLGVEDARPDIALCSFIANLNQRKKSEKAVSHEQGSPTTGKSNSKAVLENKENQTRPLLASTPVPQVESRKHLGQEKKSNKEDTSIDSLIERMECIIEPKDTRTAEVIEVFEHHIKAYQIREEHLNNLLEAKTLALSQADRVIAQLRGRQAAHAAEMKKLQNVLKESERRQEQLVAEMNEMRISTEKLQAQFEKRIEVKTEEIEAMNRMNTEIIEKCTELEERVTSCKQENKTLFNMKEDLQRAHEILKEQYNTSCSQSKQLEEERKLLSKQLKEKDGAVQKLGSSLQSLQTKYNDTEKERVELEKEKDDMEAYIDKLRNQLSTSENSCRQLQQRATTLEGINQEQAEKLKEKVTRISEVEQELEKHNQIVTFINNMHLKGGKK